MADPIELLFYNAISQISGDILTINWKMSVFKCVKIGIALPSRKNFHFGQHWCHNQTWVSNILQRTPTRVQNESRSFALVNCTAWVKKSENRRLVTSIFLWQEHLYTWDENRSISFSQANRFSEVICLNANFFGIPTKQTVAHENRYSVMDDHTI